MATATLAVPALLTLEEYLQTAYHPDCDFVDGHLEQRNVGDTPHGLLQMELGFWFRSHWEWKVRVVGELRTQVSELRVRLPDNAVVFEDAALRERPRITPPFIAIEILSTDDRISRVILRLKEFLAMGTPHVWLLDPIECVAYTLTNAGLSLVEGTRLNVLDSPIYLDLPELFASVNLDNL